MTHRALFSLCLLFALLLGACRPVQAPVSGAMAGADDTAAGGSETTATAPPAIALMDNLGDHRHPITTDSETAQAYFDQGLNLAFGFNHLLAMQSFQAALEHDPECAMCYWGIAWVLGPNINAAMDPAAMPQAWEAVQQAQALAADATPAEQAYIEALAARYSDDSSAERVTLDVAFADAMRDMAAEYPDDMDAATIFAEALMDLTPWNFWTKEGEQTEYTAEIVDTLERVLAANPDHPGANHYYIHAVEASRDPGRALDRARRLEDLVPGAGHLRHMPAHIYWRTGMYADAARVNEHAIHTDEMTVGGTPDDPTHGFYALAYYPHNIHFLFAANQMRGNSAGAVEAARYLVDQIPEDVYKELPILEDFRPMAIYALVRFGKWDEIMAEPMPAEHLPLTTGMWHYARGLAQLRQGDANAARDELAQLEEIAARPEMASMALPSFATAGQILNIAAGILGGEIAASEGAYDAAVVQLEEAVAIQDSLPYIEPPAWYYPVRQTLGAVLLEAGRAEEAEEVYRKDLEQYPENGWSLFGLMQSLEAQGKTDEANEVKEQFEAAWESADVELTSSRF
jgi:tetratricopeptide (TPR) repeat protein